MRYVSAGSDRCWQSHVHRQRSHEPNCCYAVGTACKSRGTSLVMTAKYFFPMSTRTFFFSLISWNLCLEYSQTFGRASINCFSVNIKCLKAQSLQKQLTATLRGIGSSPKLRLISSFSWRRNAVIMTNLANLKARHPFLHSWTGPAPAGHRVRPLCGQHTGR